MATELEFVNYKQFVENLPVAQDYATGDKTVVSNGTDGPRVIPQSSADAILAQKVLAGNLAPAFDPTRTENNKYLAGESVVYYGKTYVFKVDHYGAWNAADVYRGVGFTAIMDYLKLSYDISKKQNPDKNKNAIKVQAYYDGTKLTGLNTSASYHCFIFPVVPGHNYKIIGTFLNAIFASQIIFDSAEGLVGSNVGSDLYKTAPDTANYLIVTTPSSQESITLLDTSSAFDSVCNSLYGNVIYSVALHTSTGNMNTDEKTVKFEAGVYNKIHIRVSTPANIAGAYTLNAYFRNSSETVVKTQSIKLNQDNVVSVPIDAVYLQLWNYSTPSTSFNYSILITEENVPESIRALDFLNSDIFYNYKGTKAVSSGSRLDWFITEIQDAVDNDVSNFYVEFTSSDSSVSGVDMFFKDSSDNVLMSYPLVVNGSTWINVPRNAKKVEIFKSSNLSNNSTFGAYVVGAKMSSYMQCILNTLYVRENGSLASLESVERVKVSSAVSRLTNQCKPIIALVYDDSSFDNLINMANQRRLKVTIAPILNVNPRLGNADGYKYRSWVSNGHGSCAHGQVSGLSPAVPTGGIDRMNDNDANRELTAINETFDRYLLSRRGLVQFDTWQDNPHVRSIAGGYYDYVIGFGTGKNIHGKTDPYNITRANSDSNISDCVNLVNWAIGKNVLIIIGGHMTRTGKGGSYSTMAQFTNLLDLIEGYVKSGDLISLNADDAVNQFFGRCYSRSVIPYLSAKDNPCYGQQVLTDEGLKVCTDAGNKYAYSVAISGTASAGEIGVEFPGDDEMQEITITTTANEDIEDVVDDFVAQIYKAVTVRKKSISSFNVTTDLVGDSRSISVTSNTSGLSLSITMDSEGSEAVFI